MRKVVLPVAGGQAAEAVASSGRGPPKGGARHKRSKERAANSSKDRGDGKKAAEEFSALRASAPEMSEEMRTAGLKALRTELGRIISGRASGYNVFRAKQLAKLFLLVCFLSTAQTTMGLSMGDHGSDEPRVFNYSAFSRVERHEWLKEFGYRVDPNERKESARTIDEWRKLLNSTDSSAYDNETNVLILLTCAVVEFMTEVWRYVVIVASFMFWFIGGFCANFLEWLLENVSCADSIVRFVLSQTAEACSVIVYGSGDSPVLVRVTLAVAMVIGIFRLYARILAISYAFRAAFYVIWSLPQLVVYYARKPFVSKTIVSSSAVNVFTYADDGDSVKIYLNGKLIGNAAKTSLVNSKEQAVAGSRVIEIKDLSAREFRHLVFFYSKNGDAYEFMGCGFRGEYVNANVTKSCVFTAKHVYESSTHMSGAASHGVDGQRFVAHREFPHYETDDKVDGGNEADAVAIVAPSARIWAMMMPLGWFPVAPVAIADGVKHHWYDGPISACGMIHPQTGASGYYRSMGNSVKEYDLDLGIYKHATSTTNGWSGTPVLTQEGGKTIAVAIHTGSTGVDGRNYCTGLTELIEQMRAIDEPQKESPTSRKRMGRARDGEADDRRRAKSGYVSYYDDRDIKIGNGSKRGRLEKACEPETVSDSEVDGKPTLSKGQAKRLKAKLAKEKLKERAAAVEVQPIIVMSGNETTLQKTAQSQTPAALPLNTSTNLQASTGLNLSLLAISGPMVTQSAPEAAPSPTPSPSPPQQQENSSRKSQKKASKCPTVQSTASTEASKSTPASQSSPASSSGLTSQCAESPRSKSSGSGESSKETSSEKKSAGSCANASTQQAVQGSPTCAPKAPTKHSSRVLKKKLLKELSAAIRGGSIAQLKTYADALKTPSSGSLSA